MIRFLEHVPGVFGYWFYRLNLKEKRSLEEFETTYVVSKEGFWREFLGF